MAGPDGRHPGLGPLGDHVHLQAAGHLSLRHGLRPDPQDGKEPGPGLKWGCLGRGVSGAELEWSMAARKEPQSCWPVVLGRVLWVTPHPSVPMWAGAGQAPRQTSTDTRQACGPSTTACPGPVGSDVWAGRGPEDGLRSWMRALPGAVRVGSGAAGEDGRRREGSQSPSSTRLRHPDRPISTF